ncbi:hypothetical protein NL676_035625 [Syzygium grande]|nr:hypothetical protein NL676_035625 [Syzygium grande]
MNSDHEEEEPIEWEFDPEPEPMELESEPKDDPEEEPLELASLIFFLLKLRSVHLLRSIFRSHNPHQNSPNFAQPRIPHNIVHVARLLFRGLLFPALSLLLRDPCLDSPHIAVRPGAPRPSAVHQRNVSSFTAEIRERPERGLSPTEIGVRDFDGYNADGVVGVGADVHRAKLLGKEYEGLRDKVEKTQSMRIAKVQEESMANAAKIAEVKAEELDERIRCKYGQCERTNFEG